MSDQKIELNSIEQNMMESETGRSMVEMLGVLAVIGVLSIGGITAFKIGMAKHTANEIMHTVSIANNDMQAEREPHFLEVTGATFGTTGEYKGLPAFVTADIEDEDVCQYVKELAETNFIVEGGCTEETINEGKNYCSALENPYYAKNCCANVDLYECQRCDSKTGQVLDSNNGHPCGYEGGWCENGTCVTCDEKYPGTGLYADGYTGGYVSSICRCPTGNIWNYSQRMCIACNELYPGTGYGGDGYEYKGDHVDGGCYCPTGKKWSTTKRKCI